MLSQSGKHRSSFCGGATQAMIVLKFLKLRVHTVDRGDELY